MGPSKEKCRKSFSDSCLLCLARQPASSPPRSPFPHFPSENIGMSTITLNTPNISTGKTELMHNYSCNLSSDNRFFCVLLTQTYKAPLCCFQKSLCCRNNSQTCQTHIGSLPPSLTPSPDPEARKQPPGLPGTCVCLPTLPRWKLTLHFTLLLTM